ncbi:hypothetical protein [Noviherbaspirillum massiliense]|uniref:hypothetical protein n=1 Tax=Noviherbaspirillum massiliense TaxID=1465823 RepID=UPI001FE00E7D|nr:hypothetical protein [Noviherbaspirillum massiliense]
MAEISGRDGVAFSVKLSLNDPSLAGAFPGARLSLGFHVDGQTTYLMFNELRGKLELHDYGISTQKKPDGTDYMALTLPQYVKFTDFGFESMTVQTDPIASSSASLGRMNLNGTLSMQGEMRFWAH